MRGDHWTLIRGLLLFVLVLVIVEYLVATVGVQSRQVPVRTDFASYYLAGQLVQAGISPYDEAALARAGRDMGFLHDQYPFLYLPTFALLMQPLAQMPFLQARAVWMVLSTLALLLALGATASVVWRLLAPCGPQRTRVLWLLGVPFVVVALNSSAVHNDLRHGSVGAWLWMGFMFLLLAVLRRQPVRAGLWLAFATLLKVVPVVLLPWIAWRCGWRAVPATLAGVLLIALPALFVWPPTIFVTWITEALWPASQVDVAWTNNVSLMALWIRLLTPVLELDALTRASQEGIVLLGPALATELLVVLLTVRALRQRAATEGRLALELTLMALALLLIMRLTWVHTLTMMLFAYPFLLCVVLTRIGPSARKQRWWMISASLAFFLAVAHLPVLWSERWMTWPWLLAPGLPTLGVLSLWGMSLRLLSDEPQP